LKETGAAARRRLAGYAVLEAAAGTYRGSLPVRQRLQMTFITAAAMPRLIARAGVGRRDGKMLPSNAAAPAGAGVLSVRVFPAAPVRLSGPSARRRPGRTAGNEQPPDSK
jgi:hypothetical protein